MAVVRSSQVESHLGRNRLTSKAPYKACSGFTRVTARWIAQPPKAAFVTRLRPGRLPCQAARQLPDQSTTLWVEPSSTGDTRRRGALGNAGLWPWPRMNEVARFEPECLNLICRDWANRIHLFIRSHHGLDDFLGHGGVAFGNNEFGEHRITALESERGDPDEKTALRCSWRFSHRSSGQLSSGALRSLASSAQPLDP